MTPTELHDKELAALAKKRHLRPERKKFDGKVYINNGWSPKKSDLETHRGHMKDKYFVRIVKGNIGDSGWIMYVRKK